MLVEEAFDRLDATRISLVVFPDNRPAINCYLQAGFTQVCEEMHQFGFKGPQRKLLRFEIHRFARQNRDRRPNS
jgi:RimJ/RimL family protein N-acetyltransferase